MSAPTIDHLLTIAPDSPSTVLSHLTAHPSLASAQDAHGYSLLHAAASYSHPALLSALVRTYHVDPNLLDEDGETALFAVEDRATAALLLELGTSRDVKNADGLTARERLEADGESEDVVEFLAGGEAGGGEGGSGGGIVNGIGGGDGDGDERVRPPVLPRGVEINVGTMLEDEAGGEPDPEFRRRIEELAARADFGEEGGQRELRRLVEDAVRGIEGENGGRGDARRRRVG